MKTVPTIWCHYCSSAGGEIDQNPNGPCGSLKVLDRHVSLKSAYIGSVLARDPIVSNVYSLLVACWNVS